jgi:hypothetical protein
MIIVQVYHFDKADEGFSEVLSVVRSLQINEIEESEQDGLNIIPVSARPKAEKWAASARPT